MKGRLSEARISRAIRDTVKQATLVRRPTIAEAAEALRSGNADACAGRQRAWMPVSTNMPDNIFELMQLYPQPVWAHGGGGVEYLPVPRQKDAVRRAA